MTIKEFRTKLPTLKDEERRIMEPLMGMLCPISVAQMRKFQNDWDFEGNPPPEMGSTNMRPPKIRLSLNA